MHINPSMTPPIIICFAVFLLATAKSFAFDVNPARRFISPNKILHKLRLFKPSSDELKLSPIYRQEKNNFEECRLRKQCAGSRLCQGVDDVIDKIVPCIPTLICRCLPANLLNLQCSSNQNCDVAESCYRNICVSDAVLQLISSPPADIPNRPSIGTSSSPTISSPAGSGPPVTTVKATTTSTISPAKVPSPTPQPERGLTGGRCTANGHCIAPRSCVNITGNGRCQGQSCICLPKVLTACENPSSCAVGEVCLKEKETDGSIAVKGICISKNTTEELKPEDSVIQDDGCISVHHLQHLEQKQLVYERYRVARVLCDGMENCATPGHIVQYRGDAMMMKNYCMLAVCHERVMAVNSPRYSRGRDVCSNHNDLLFSSFSARFKTALEANVIAFGIRMGL